MAEAERQILRSLWEAAIAAVDPVRRVQEALSDTALRRALRAASVSGRVGVFAVGKAAAGMYEGAAGERRGASGLVVLPAGYPRPPASGARILFASHPEPDSSSVAAARSALEYFRKFGRDDTVVSLISGGTSSLLCLPRRGLTLSRKRSRIRRLTRSGASIRELNRLRTSLSAVKGGGLGRATAARLVTLVLSDVPRDDPRIVGSGPTIRTRARGHRGDVVRVVASNGAGLEAAGVAAAAAGAHAVRVRWRLAGDSVEAGRRLARRALRLAPGEVLLAGGETTVRMSGRPGKGRGGRCLELALAASQVLEGSDVMLLAAASDGMDGSSGAAGAWADGETVARCRASGLSIERALARHDTAALWEALGDLLVTGPTGTNVCDWVFAVRTDSSRRGPDLGAGVSPV